MRYYLDTEFIEDGRTIDLLSIGLVADDGRELYLCNSEWDRTSDPRRAKPLVWVLEHVVPYLGAHSPEGDIPWRSRADIRDAVEAFIGVAPTAPEIWAYYASYDWVAFCQLFGRMVDLPRGYPAYCRDLKQLIADENRRRESRILLPTPQELTSKMPSVTHNASHHALFDARWNRDVHQLVEATREPPIEASLRAWGRAAFDAARAEEPRKGVGELIVGMHHELTVALDAWHELESARRGRRSGEATNEARAREAFAKVVRDAARVAFGERWDLDDAVRSVLQKESGAVQTDGER